MAISVKYFGSSDIPAFERDFGSMEELVKENPFKPYGKANQTGPTGKQWQFAKESHRGLKGLEWRSAGHVGEAGKYAGFDDNGNPAYLDVSALLSIIDKLSARISDLESSVNSLNSRVEELEAGGALPDPSGLPSGSGGLVAWNGSEWVARETTIMDIVYNNAYSPLTFTQSKVNLVVMRTTAELEDSTVFTAVSECPSGS
jgi:hypothetical protein